jgi:hypothetical protein
MATKWRANLPIDRPSQTGLKTVSIRPKTAYNLGVKSLLIFGAICASVIVAGCKSPESRVIGKWMGPNNQAAFELKGDKTFTSGPPMQTAGTWKIDEKTVTLKVDTIQGKPKAQFLKDSAAEAAKMGVPKATIDSQMKQADKLLAEMKLTVGEEGETLIMPNPMGGPSITLVKEKA